MLTSKDEAGLRDEIQDLFDNQIQENRYLEYKTDFPSNSRKSTQQSPGLANLDKSEFLADVSAFANSAGGTLIYGVTERKNDRGKNTGIPAGLLGIEGVVSLDDTVRNLESLLRQSLDPRIAGVRVSPVSGYHLGPIIVILIPRSFAAPHGVRRRGLVSYHARTTGGSHVMDTNELRSSFLQTAGLRDGLEASRDDFIRRISAKETPRTLIEGAQILMQVIPISALSLGHPVDLRKLGSTDLKPPLWRNSNGWDHAFCWEGFVAFTGTEDVGCYSLARRDGTLEIASAFTLPGNALKNKKKSLGTNEVEELVLDSLPDLQDTLALLGQTHPLAVLVTLRSVRGTVVVLPNQHPAFQSVPLRHDVLKLPPVDLDSPDTDLGKAFRPSFDAMWQAGGHKGSPNYDSDGNWQKNW